MCVGSRVNSQHWFERDSICAGFSNVRVSEVFSIPFSRSLKWQAFSSVTDRCLITGNKWLFMLASRWAEWFSDHVLLLLCQFSATYLKVFWVRMGLFQRRLLWRVDMPLSEIKERPDTSV